MLDKYGCNYFNYSENGVYTPVSGICWTASFLPGIFLAFVPVQRRQRIYGGCGQV